jgi:D-beta-D-heptose 7-phosphate kinase/D-beta-D-heptose 1-phosphate adenosyltransferase
VHAAELQRALLNVSVSEVDDKIMPRDEACGRVRQWQAEGLRVGFTNGCFDLIHPGHINLLKRARATCDRLVVALNADESVRRLKGPTRPVQSETARALVMASIVCVDIVTLFDEDTPLALIEALRPDVLIKGADYTLDQVVGADLVRRNGGRIVLVPLEEGHSTTSIIARAT